METSPVLKALAARYRASQSGRTGKVVKDFTMDFRELLRIAGTVDGEARVLAERELTAAAEVSKGLLSLDHAPRDPSTIIRVRLAREGGEAWLFPYLGLVTPGDHRRRLAEMFFQAAIDPVPAPWEKAWHRWCHELEAAALSGQSLSPFSREDGEANRELLRVLRGVLAWPGESLVRFASCVICGNSKTLEALRPGLEQALRQISGGTVTSLAGLGLLETPRQVLLHGPLRLELPHGVLDAGLLSGPLRISEKDIALALHVSSTASRCLSVENETTFHELAKLQSGVLLVQTSYPGRGVRKLYERLPQDLPCWHFGDADPAGFDILRDLRVRTGRPIEALHMRFRAGDASEPLGGQEKALITRLAADPLLADVRDELLAMQAAGHKGRYEQESLGWPRAAWPFYAVA